jgi:hypothetical protein
MRLKLTSHPSPSPLINIANFWHAFPSGKNVSDTAKYKEPDAEHTQPGKVWKKQPRRTTTLLRFYLESRVI